MTDTSQILVVEDEPLVALDLEEMLVEMGFVDIDVAHSLSQADYFSSDRSYLAAFLDFNLAGEASLDLAWRLRGAGTRLIFISGYVLKTSMLSDLRAQHAPKPFSLSTIAGALAALGIETPAA